MEPPESLPYLVTLRYLTDYLRQTSPSFPIDSKDALDAAFRKYKNAYYRKSFQPFFQSVKGKIWFREKYEPSKEMEEMRKGLRKKGREGKLERWLEDVEGGALDEVRFDVVPKTELNASTTTTTNGNATEDAEMKPATEEDVKPKVESDVKPKVESDVKPKIEADVKPEIEEQDEDSQMRERDSLPEPDDVKLAPVDSQLFIKAISPDLSRKDLEAHCAQCPGFEYLALSEPNPQKNNIRVGWVQFRDASNMAEAQKVLCESTVGNFTLHMQPSEKIMFAKSKLVPSDMAAPERIIKDLEQIRQVAAGLEKEIADTRGSEVIEARYETGREADSSIEGLAALNLKTFDLYLHYLRTVFNTCYYCLSTHDFKEELERKCPKHLRKTVEMDANRGISKKTIDLEWVKKLDEKMPLLANKDTVDPCDFGGDNYEEELHRLCRSKIKQEEEVKFRCNVCTKLFSALKFIEKHLSTKHPEVLGDTLEDVGLCSFRVLAEFSSDWFYYYPTQVKYFNNYILDPCHPLAPHEQEVDRSSILARPALGETGRSLNDRIGERIGDDRGSKRRRDDGPPAPRGPPPPPPPGAVLDPRARKGASSYADLDGTPAGVADVILPY
ncbi:hypothetical protein P7C70_g818, partial [Phenoliferia sp. Uapishka_3]